jgi:hypothetical protein
MNVAEPIRSIVPPDRPRRPLHTPGTRGRREEAA